MPAHTPQPGDQPRDTTIPAEATDIQSLFDEIVHRHPAIGLAVGVVRNGELESFHGHGVADVESNTPITQDTAFRIASITKTFTAVAVMQLWEAGLVDLDAPANDYLRSYQLIPTHESFRPATIRHLLTHTAGLPELAHPGGAIKPDFGESVPAGQPIPSLAEFYRSGLRIYAEPGTRFVYGNHSPATLGQLVEDVSGQSLDGYFREHIFEPLQMSNTDLQRSDRIRDRLATGYEIVSRGVKTIADRDMVTIGAASIYSTPDDMSRYMTALLGGGANRHGRILEPETMATMFEPHYQPDPRIPGQGLGFFRYNLGGHLAVGHQGTIPGFHSHMVMAPVSGIGVMASTNGAHQADFWLPPEVSGLLGHLLGTHGEPNKPPGPHRPDLWEDLCGWYRLPARPTDIRLRGMMGAGIEVYVRGGRLMLRFLTPIPSLANGFPLIPDDEDDPYVMKVELSESGLESLKVVFSQDHETRTDTVHFDLMPLSLPKGSAAHNPRRWALGAVGAASAAVILRRLT